MSAFSKLTRNLRNAGRKLTGKPSLEDEETEQAFQGHQRHMNMLRGMKAHSEDAGIPGGEKTEKIYSDMAELGRRRHDKEGRRTKTSYHGGSYHSSGSD